MGQQIQLKNRLFVERSILVSTYDIDFAGHVSNIAYLRWCEDMRRMLFEKYFPLKMFMDQGKTPVIASTNIEYKRPISLFDNPHGFMWIADVGKVSIAIEAEFKVNEQLTTRVKHIGVFIDLQSGRPVRVPSVCAKMFHEQAD